MLIPDMYYKVSPIHALFMHLFPRHVMQMMFYFPDPHCVISP